MKKSNFLRLLFVISFMTIMYGIGLAQIQTAQHYNVTAGSGNGLRFWGHNNYKIHMGNLDEHKYGPVTSYSIKSNMSNHSQRGWTWGVAGQTPVTALNIEGHFQTEGWVRSMEGTYYLGNIQNLQGDNSSLLTYKSNHSTITTFKLNDKEGTRYGQVYGGSNGATFGLLDGDGNWSYLAAKDNYTAFRINNNERMRILSNGNVDIIGGSVNLKKPNTAGGWARGLFNTDAAGTRLGGIGLLGTADTPVRYFISHGEKPWLDARGTFFLPNGNVGIGTTTPENALDVVGTIRAEKCIIELDWADYVFYNDYNLPTLEEEEKYIEENGHLLGFESEEDMAGEIQLGDVSKRQQVKIEEIMLHLIDIKKEVVQSKNEIAELNEEIVELKKENEQLKEQTTKN